MDASTYKVSEMSTATSEQVIDTKVAAAEGRGWKFVRLFVVALLLFQAGMLAYLSWSTSPNRTEVGHIGAVAYFWHTGKFDVFHVNPPLTRFIAGAPIALFCNPEYDWRRYSIQPQDRCEWTLGNAFIGANELDDVRLYMLLTRVALIPLILVGGYFGFRFALELYGAWSGIVFLVLWTFSPLVLGWGATLCPDVVASSMGIVGLYTYWHWLKNPGWSRAVIAGICLGLMPLAKMTWVIAIPIWCLLYAIWWYTRKQHEQSIPLRQFASILLLAVYVINSGYFYDGSFRLLKDYKFISGTLTGVEMKKDTLVKPGNRFAESWLGYVPVPLPSEFVQGIDTQKLDFERGMESYARGVWSDRGWWWYYGYVLMLKEPLGVWVLTFFAVGASCFYKCLNATWQDELIVLLPMLLVFAFLSSQDGFSIHPRYVILILPLLYIFVAKLAGAFVLKKRLLAVVVVICLTWIIASSIGIYPHSMSYMNELAGVPKNWPKCLLGSNIDWGQDAFYLKAWREKHPFVHPAYITYTNSFSYEQLGIEKNREVPTDATTGVIVIGVNELYENNGKYQWLWKYNPVEIIGKTIWIYSIDVPKKLNTPE